MTQLFVLEFGVALLVCVVAVASEVRTGAIPNLVTLGSVVVGAVVAAYDGHWGAHLGGFAAAAAAMLLVYRAEGLGGGVVKLVAGVGAILGFRPAIAMLVVAVLLALVALGWQRLRGRSGEILGSPFALLGVVGAAVLVRMPALQSVFQ